MNLPRGIYAIKHNVTKRIYVGSSEDPQKRFASHLNALRRGRHIVEDMQKDFNEHGEDFTFFILGTITKFEDRGREYEFMEFLESHIRGKGYNYNDRVFTSRKEGK